MASVSIGDIVLCSQIAYRLITAATSGRKNAPRDLTELNNTLLALSFSLAHLQKTCTGILSRNTTQETNARDIQEHLGLMVRSCRQTLEDLERMTAKYRDTIKDPTEISSSASPGSIYRAKVRIQWRRFMWDLREESLTRYRHKLETHTAAINLMLSTCIWSTADRIEEDGRRQAQRLDELLRRTSHVDGTFSRLMQSIHLPMRLGIPRIILILSAIRLNVAR
ncbi:uncharacterized protein N7511_003375 [Penicillium nucicola]|uniref:uncharacterized protein n=1 Tax=Penicillium nucicola TaxID=1850975 RepID=UPI00254538F2|nr:uncharacterized protein N7511_003375 [Penicillium nucicola]KAJ5771324.1 hypothetical protein N7511_003375 [Penicillium nucicola]